MTFLLLYSELLLEENLQENACASVEVIHNQTEKLCSLRVSLVKMSRLENGILTVSPRLTSLQPMLESIAARYAASAAEKALTLYLTDTDVSARFDAKWTVEALANIVGNAIKYTRQGGVTISAASYEMFARIDVTDSGIGISESEQAQIFSRFYRPGAVREQEGVGIELYLARQIISAEGGYIKVTSQFARGRTFSVCLPK